MNLYNGGTMVVNKNVVIAIWQSIYTIKDQRWFEQYEAVFVDECLHPDTLITMGDSTRKKISDINVGDIVKTRNEKTGLIENKPVLKVHKNLSKSEQMFEFELDNGEIIRITGNHKVYTQRGWVRADELTCEDSINSFN